MNSSAKEPSALNQGLHLVGFVLMFLLFIGIVGATYLVRRPDSVESELADHRVKVVNQVRAEGKKKLDQYQWVDAKAGVVRIPITEAMQQTVAAYGRAQAESPAPNP